MKLFNTIEERNAIVEKNLSLIDKAAENHSDIIKTASMDEDDVYQQLAVRLVKAVDAYDESQGELEGYLETQLERELFCCAHPRRLYGLTDAPTALRKNRVVSLDALKETAARQKVLAA